VTVDLSTQDHYIVHPPRFNSYICAGSCNYDAFHNNTVRSNIVDVDVAVVVVVFFVFFCCVCVCACVYVYVYVCNNLLLATKKS